MIFTEYVAEHQRGLLRFATALTTDEALAEDVVQDVLARAYTRWATISELELRVPGGWLTIDVDKSHVSRYPDRVVRKIAESVTFATIDQPSTWFDAETAVPH